MRIAIIGAGLGGSAGAALLQQAGYDVRVYEQAPQFSRLGAGIHVSPNVMRVMRRIGIEPRLRAIALRPKSFRSRDADTGKISFDFPLADSAEKRYGAPYLILHRGDFHAEIMRAVQPGTIVFNKRLIGFWSHMIRDRPDEYLQVYAETTRFEPAGDRLTRRYLVGIGAVEALEAELGAAAIDFDPIDMDDVYPKYEATPPEWFQIPH